jgi:hypothetical protein
MITEEELEKAIKEAGYTCDIIIGDDLWFKERLLKLTYSGVVNILNDFKKISLIKQLRLEYYIPLKKAKDAIEAAAIRRKFVEMV